MEECSSSETTELSRPSRWQQIRHGITTIGLAESAADTDSATPFIRSTVSSKLKRNTAISAVAETEPAPLILPEWPQLPPQDPTPSHFAVATATSVSPTCDCIHGIRPALPSAHDPRVAMELRQQQLRSHKSERLRRSLEGPQPPVAFSHPKSFPTSGIGDPRRAQERALVRAFDARLRASPKLCLGLPRPPTSTMHFAG